MALPAANNRQRHMAGLWVVLYSQRKDGFERHSVPFFVCAQVMPQLMLRESRTTIVRSFHYIFASCTINKRRETVDDTQKCVNAAVGKESTVDLRSLRNEMNRIVEIEIRLLVADLFTHEYLTGVQKYMGCNLDQ